MSRTVAAPVTAGPADDADRAPPPGLDGGGGRLRRDRVRPASISPSTRWCSSTIASSCWSIPTATSRRRALLARALPGRHPDPEPLRAVGARRPPDLLSAQVPSAFGAQIDLAISNLPFGGDRWDPRNVVHIRRELVLADRLVERVTLTGYLGTPEDYWVDLDARLRLRRHLRGARMAAARARAVLRARADRRRARCSPTVAATAASSGRVVRFRQPPDRLTERSARWNLRLECRPAGRARVGGVRRRRRRPASRSRPRRWTTAAAPWTTSTAAWHEGNSRWETDVADFDAPAPPRRR